MELRLILLLGTYAAAIAAASVALRVAARWASTAEPARRARRLG